MNQISPNCDLRLLLDFANENLDAATAITAKKQIQADVVLTSKLETIVRAKKQTTQLNCNDGKPKSIPTTNQEVVAAFLDGKLKEKGNRSFEEKCWKSERLLKEVISAHAFLHEEKKLDSVADFVLSSTKKSELLSIAIGTSIATEQANHETQHLPTVALARTKDIDPIRETSRLRWLGLAVAITIMLVGIGSVIFFASKFQPLPDQKLIVTPSVNQPADTPEPKVEKSLQPKIEADKNSSERDAPTNNTNSNPTFDAKEENTDNPGPLESDRLPKKTEPIKPFIAPPTQRRPIPKIPGSLEIALKNDPEKKLNPQLRFPVDLKWERRRRGVIVHRVALGKWAGIDSPLVQEQKGTATPTNRSTEFLALPDSWGQVNVPEFGTIALTANSHLRIYREGTIDNEKITIELLNGKIAFPRFERKLSFLLKHRGILIQTDVNANSRLLLHWGNQNFETLAYAGTVEMKFITKIPTSNNPLNLQSQATLRPDATWNLVTLGFRKGVVNDLKSPARIRMPAGKQVMNSRKQRELLESDDVAKEMEPLLTDRNRLTRQFAFEAQISLNPETYFPSAFSSADDEVRDAAMNWIFNRPSNAVVKIINNIGGFSGVSMPKSMIRDFFALVSSRNLPEGSPPRTVDATVAMRWASNLDHPEIAVRTVAHYCLTNVIIEPTSIRYSASAAKPARARAIELWEKHIQVAALNPNSNIVAGSSQNPANTNRMGAGNGNSGGNSSIDEKEKK